MDTVTVRDALTTNTVGFISIRDLAQLIEAPAERLRPLVEHECLRVRTPDSVFERTIVARPGNRATEWLRNMFQPLKMRPLIPLKEAGKLWRITEREVLKYCQLRKIPVQSDPVFGNLITFAALKSLARARFRGSTGLHCCGTTSPSSRACVGKSRHPTARKWRTRSSDCQAERAVADRTECRAAIDIQRRQGGHGLLQSVEHFNAAIRLLHGERDLRRLICCSRFRRGHGGSIGTGDGCRFQRLLSCR